MQFANIKRYGAIVEIAVVVQFAYMITLKVHVKFVRVVLFVNMIECAQPVKTATEVTSVNIIIGARYAENTQGQLCASIQLSVINVKNVILLDI